jgi:hypothetical protein
MKDKEIEENAKEYAYTTDSVKGKCCPDCGTACTARFCNRDIANAYIAGYTDAKKKEDETNNNR